jgi:hypothetical protein
MYRKLRDTAERAIASWSFAHGISLNAFDNEMFREAVMAVGRAGMSFQPAGRKKLPSRDVPRRILPTYIYGVYPYIPYGVYPYIPYRPYKYTVP